MKIAIVTGASSGMGREAVIQIADRFSGIGEIWVIARRRERMEELRREVPAPLRIFPLDLAEEETGMVRINSEALCGVTHLVLPYMTAHSRILMFASAAGFLPQPGFAVYAATKAFVVSYSRALNVELKPKDIVVTAVCPGPVATEFFEVAKAHGKIPFYKQLAMADPRRVIRKALKDSMMGKEISVYGPVMKAFCLICKVLPQRLILGLMEKGKP